MKNSSTFIKSVKDLKKEISKDGIEQVIKYLDDVLKESSIYDDFILLSNLWINYKRNHITGQFYQQEAIVEKARLSKKILDFLDSNEIEIENLIIFNLDVDEPIFRRVDRLMNGDLRNVPFIKLEYPYLIFRETVLFTFKRYIDSLLLPVILGFGGGLALLFLFVIPFFLEGIMAEDFVRILFALLGTFFTYKIITSSFNEVKELLEDTFCEIKIDLDNLDVFVKRINLNLVKFQKIEVEPKKYNQNLIKIHILGEDKNNYLIYFPTTGYGVHKPKFYTNKEVKLINKLFKEILKGVKN